MVINEPRGIENHKNDHEDINVIEFIQSRSKEIQAIEESINKTNKKTMLFQRLPFYKRRRNRNYDKRKAKKFTYRKRDRHFLRTHNYYSKRFFMLKVDDLSIPFKRRIKSSKYIYKSQKRGFIFDESFRKAIEYLKTDIFRDLSSNEDIVDSFNPNSMSIQDFRLKLENTPYLNSNSYNTIQKIDNEYEIIFKKFSIILIGRELNIKGYPIDCVFSVMKNNNINEILEDYKSQFDQDDSKTANISEKCFNLALTEKLESQKNFSFYNSISNQSNDTKYDKDGLESSKIFCSRREAMNILQKFISSNIIPICLSEIHRLHLENDCISIYDNVKSDLFKNIEKSICAKIFEKYNKTPSSKKQSYDISRLFISNESIGKYFIFKAIKGSIDPSAEIYCETQIENDENDEFSCIYGDPIGRVVRSEYKFTSGQTYGLGFFNENFEVGKYKNLKNFLCKNLNQNNCYPIEIVKYFEHF